MVNARLRVGDLVRMRPFGDHKKGQLQFSVLIVNEEQVACCSFRLANSEVVSHPQVGARPAWHPQVSQCAGVCVIAKHLNALMTLVVLVSVKLFVNICCKEKGHMVFEPFIFDLSFTCIVLGLYGCTLCFW